MKQQDHLMTWQVIIGDFNTEKITAALMEAVTS